MKDGELEQELKEEFKKMQAELGFKSSFEDLDKIFFISDDILNQGYISPNLSRQVCHRIVETFMLWNNYLHSLILPNPQSMINLNESKMFDQDKRKEISDLITKAMALVSINQVVGLTKDKKAEAKFIDDALEFWNKTYKPKIEEITKKISKGWKSE